VVGVPAGRDDFGAEGGDGGARRLVADRGDDLRTGRGTELDARRADATGAAVDEQPLAGPEVGLGEEGVLRGGKDLGEAARRRRRWP